ncbi:MAG: Hint domain-containing protein [Pseudomonadota bacterium]
MRKYEVAYLLPNGDEHSSTRLAPATPLFESAFMALARGTLIATPMGPVAIEDIQPGMMVSTLSDGPQPVVWKGATTIVPGAPGQSEEASILTRVPGDAWGMQRPSHDLLLGFGARILRATQNILVPATTLIDGDTAFSVQPPSPVRVFHLALPRHACIQASGINVETYHPGDIPRRYLRPEVQALFLSLFPHLDNLNDFGPLRVGRSGEENHDMIG